MAYTPIANGNSGLVARGIINGIGTGLDSHIATTGSSVHSLKSMVLQSASAVDITGGTITNVGYPTTNVAVADSPYTIKTTDFTIRCNATTGSIIINLLPATGTKRIYNIKNLYTSACVVDVVADITGTPDLIDGEASKTLSVKSNMQIQDGATNYWDIL